MIDEQLVRIYYKYAYILLSLIKEYENSNSCFTGSTFFNAERI